MNKKILSLLVAIAATTVALNAQKVALHSASGVQHFTGADAISAAYAASASGDTLYLPGGSFNLPTDGFDKQLAIFGAGHYPDSITATLKTYLNGDFRLKENADGFHLEGVEISGYIDFAQDKSINNVTIKRCKFPNVYMTRGLSNTADSTYSNNIYFIGNVVTASLQLQNGRNVFVSNNIIGKQINYSKGNQITNNLFIDIPYYSGSYQYNIKFSDNNSITNNVFLAEVSYIVSGQSNMLYNNIFTVSTAYLGTTSISGNNYFSVPRDSIFVNQTGESFDYSHDYHLQSPTTYLGNDGTQVGIYGGMFPYKEGAVPMNPHIQMHNIAPTASSGQLNVEIKAASQDD